MPPQSANPSISVKYPPGLYSHISVTSIVGWYRFAIASVLRNLLRFPILMVQFFARHIGRKYNWAGGKFGKSDLDTPPETLDVDPIVRRPRSHPIQILSYSPLFLRPFPFTGISLVGSGSARLPTHVSSDPEFLFSFHIPIIPSLSFHLA